MKRALTFTTIGALLLAVVAFLGWKREDSRYSEARTTVLMREIGHRILLQSGDSVSRILPVKQLRENTYQLRFEKQLRFFPDSVVAIVGRVVARGNLPADYIVDVRDCRKHEEVFSFAIRAKAEERIVPCIGRLQPEGCYYMQISFQQPPLVGATGKWISGIAVLGVLLAWLIIRLVNRRRNLTVAGEEHPEEPAGGVSIGQYALRNGELKFGHESIALSVKEAKLLSIFASSPNQVIDRKQLQKEGWEDEGVIVGRSLDVFISKLRKKLEKDTAVKLVNIHGKGYKLEIGIKG